MNNVREFISKLPDKPGVYQFYDSDEKLLYVGKAKNLKKRVFSYFQKDPENNKVRVLVSKIANVKYIVVNSEADALLLENNLIKEFQPKYNINLKDDKTFPWVCIKNENFPRIFLTRKKENDGSEYFGPFTSVFVVRTILELIKQIYPLRNCGYDLSSEKIDAKKFKPCLEYSIGNCKAPCIGLQTLVDYSNNINQIKEILRGNISSVKNLLKELMVEFAGQHRFEEAQKAKEKFEILDKFQAKSSIVNESINNVDVFSILTGESKAYVNYLKIISGAVVNVLTVELSKRLDEDENDLLLFALVDIRNKVQSTSSEVILPFKPDISIPGIKFTVPKSGDKLKLLEISERNARYFKLHKLAVEENYNPNNAKLQKLEKVKRDLRLRLLPTHIECFDNSNLQGTNPVASCVVFKDLVPSKRDYRHFNVKTVIGPDDFSSMEEIVYRRYRRLLDEGQDLPQLVVIDGGKGQLNAALASLSRLDILDRVSVISIAKKLEEIYFPNDPIPMYLDKHSETLRIIQHLRNEAHRFGITFHKNKRSNAFLNSELDEIKGISDKTKIKLLSELKTITNIKAESIQGLSKLIGKSKAQIIYNFFHSN